MLFYKPRRISEIDFKRDGRIALIGKVSEQFENEFILSDETGRVEIFFEGEVKENQTVRVFCSIIENRLKADIVQGLNDFNLQLFRKVENMYKKLGLNI
ncbi:MAG: hypothetical protein QW412_00590 [Candidatus Aenigmatarchaeota archaeon]